MIAHTKVKKIAKAMFAKSLEDGQIDSDKVKKILKIAATARLPYTSKVLKSYKKLISDSLAKQQISIEAAAPLDKKQLSALLSKTGAKTVKVKTNSKMVFGARITHGDWVFDASLDAKLKQLTIDN